MRNLLFILLACTLCYPLVTGSQPQQRGLKVVALDPSTKEKVQLYQESRAILIGIDKYQQVEHLDYAAADAVAMKNLLIMKFGFQEKNIRLLTNDDATRANIDVELRSLRKFGDADRAIVFFAGHGQTIDLPGGGEMGYIVPVDGDPDPDAVDSTCIPMSRIKQVSDFSPAKHILFLVDACYGGLAASAARRVLSPNEEGYLVKVTNARARQIITAGGRGEEVIEKPEWGHSAFTYKILDGLDKGFADKDNDGLIYASELANYLQKSVSLITENRQTPKFRPLSEDEGDFVFILTKSTQAVASDFDYGEIFVSSYPDSAEIYLDRKNTNLKTPALLKYITEGNHTIELKKDFLVAEQALVVLPHQINKVDLALEMAKGILKLSSTPLDANIWIDGQWYGRTPFTVDLRGGFHKIKFYKDGFIEDSTSVEIKPYDQAIFHLPLKVPSNLAIKSEPVGSEVYLDDKLLGITPMNLTKLPPGVFNVRIHNQDSVYYDWLDTVHATEGSSREVYAKLTKKYGLLSVQAIPQDVGIYLDGGQVSSGSLEKYQLLVGKHTVEFRHSSLKQNYNVNINTQTGYENQVEAKFIDFSSTSLWRSALIPGWGQLYDGSTTTGLGFLLGSLGAGAFSIVKQIEYSKKIDEYNILSQSYLNATSDNEASRLRSELITKYTDVDNVSKTRRIAFIATAAMYGLNLLDVFIFHTSKHEVRVIAKDNSIQVSPTVSSLHGDIRWQMQINF